MLIVNQEQFKTGYDYDITPYIQTLTFNNSDYISWSNVIRITKELFPNMAVKFQEPTYTYNEDGRTGMMLNPCIVDLTTGEESQIVAFPVMDSKNKAISKPNTREISDSMQRASVKCVASILGIGLRLWSRDDIDSPQKKGDKAHKKYLYLIKVNQLTEVVLEQFGQLPSAYIKPNFGDTLFTIRQAGIALNEFIEAGGVDKSKSATKTKRTKKTTDKPAEKDDQASDN